MLKKLEIIGLRGFATLQTLELAQAGQGLGSGLTILVGANNVGKSTVIEAFRALAKRNPNPSFTQGRRNRKAEDMVKIRITDHTDKVEELRSVVSGSSETERYPNPSEIDLNKLLVLPSRRTFNPYFSRSESTRSVYITQIGFPTVRTSAVDEFAYRLFTAQKNQSKFNEVLKKLALLNHNMNYAIAIFSGGQSLGIGIQRCLR
ncbi:AAA family ATPase [Anabaena subtropica]|uniref:AAA family ATPase n=1 Tax=Anabaena subtropica FACHB-260 TaxID=2692884 RepID=A0ABR8CT25_9NOST|nr:AAA family ATPase [Anabaena subtropica]MBD2345524.1 AAA family ATPase [Anabaena subtropica FACHB-260]